jgi:hypothetical protein
MEVQGAERRGQIGGGAEQVQRCRCAEMKDEVIQRRCRVSEVKIWRC